MSRLTDETVARLRDLHAAVTQPLPWVAVDQGGRAVVLDDNGAWVADYGLAPADAAYGAEAANAVPLLLAEVTSLRRKLAELKAALDTSCGRVRP